jgi:cytochrome c biogenesis protein
MMTTFLERLASLKLTLAALLLLGAGVLYSYSHDAWRTAALVAPLALLSANLLAAVATHPQFRRNLPLLVFHLALLALVLLIALGRMTYLKGRVELAEGEAFAGTLLEAERGPWHRGGLDRFTFVNRGFAIDYGPGLRRGRTVNRVDWQDAAGRRGSSVIGDHTPLVLEGYRFYTSPNKGFAPAFLWQRHGHEPLLGTVNLPSYPLRQFEQAMEWQPPGSAAKVWVMLQFDETILDPDKPSHFRLPKNHRLVVRVGQARHELRPGEGLDLPGGRLVYQGLRSWMGYQVFYDWTTPWLLAACFLAAASLGWHYWRKFAARPWHEAAGTHAATAESCS